MTFGQTTAWLTLSAALLATVGCATQSARTQFVNSGDRSLPAHQDRILPTHHKAQLLAAARQYEKEGRPDLAVRYYRQALAAEGQNTIAQGDLEFAQPGRYSIEPVSREIIAAAQPQSRPRLRSGQEFSLRNSGIDKRTAQIIANAAARATAAAIANAAAQATDEYLAIMDESVRSRKGEPGGASPSTVPTAVAATVANSAASVHQPVAHETSHGHQGSSVHAAAYEFDREFSHEQTTTRTDEQTCDSEIACEDDLVCKCETTNDDETAGEAVPAAPDAFGRKVANVEADDAEITKTDAVQEDVAETGAVNGNVVNLDVVTFEVVTHVAGEPAPVEPSDFTVSSATAASQGLPQIIPRDWRDDSRWRSTSLTRLCHDANAAVLREVAKLDSEDPKIRNEGLRGLANMGPDASSATLAVRMLLHDDVDSVRAHAAWATWALTGDAHSVGPLLTELLESTDTDVVQFAAYSLSGIGERARTALPTLSDLLETEDKLIRVHAAEALVRIAVPADREEAVDTLIMMTADPNIQIRVLALLALGKAYQRPTASMTTALTSALHDSDAAVRAVAALTLGGFGPSARSTIAQLEFIAESDQQDVQQAAATALDCIRR